MSADRLKPCDWALIDDLRRAGFSHTTIVDALFAERGIYLPKRELDRLLWERMGGEREKERTA
jgi:hypothetical protein